MKNLYKYAALVLFLLGLILMIGYTRIEGQTSQGTPSDTAKSSVQAPSSQVGTPSDTARTLVRIFATDDADEPGDIDTPSDDNERDDDGDEREDDDDDR